MLVGRLRARLIRFIPLDQPDGDLYVPLPSTDPSVEMAMKVFDELATKIEGVIADDEPYEISLVGLKPHCCPVVVIGMANPNRIEDLLHETNLIFHTHVRQSYPAVFANNADRNVVLSSSVLKQIDVPPIGASCGLINHDRHSVSLGGYIHLSLHPKSVCMLTVPPTYQVSNGDIISQPSLADRDKSYEDEYEMCKVIVDSDPAQRAALEARWNALQETFELGRVIGVSPPPTPPSSESTPITPSPSDFGSKIWAVAEITRATTSKVMMEAKPWTLPFRHIRPSRIRMMDTGLIVSKRGRTTGYTIGTVNGVKSLYRLPKDGRGVRRLDYIVVSHPWGGAFAYPGDAGAIVSAHAKEDIEGANRITKPGSPCGMVIAASTSGHITFVQCLDVVLSNIEESGLGRATFITPPGSS